MGWDTEVNIVLLMKHRGYPGLDTHTHNPSIWEEEAAKFQVQGQPGLDSQSLMQRKQQKLGTEFYSPEFACLVQGPGLALKRRE